MIIVAIYCISIVILLLINTSCRISERIILARHFDKNITGNGSYKCLLVKRIVYRRRFSDLNKTVIPDCIISVLACRHTSVYRIHI